jgi:lactate dehydrogenase-like 2-hydroxyacid dehydrogenase
MVGGKETVIITALGEGSFSQEQLQRLCAGLRVRFHAQLNPMTPADFISLTGSAEIIGLTRRPQLVLDRSIIDFLPKLRGVAIYATGTDWLDLDALAERHVAVSHLPDYSTTTVAEHTVALLLTLSRRLHLSHDRSRGMLSPETSLRGWELQGKRIGIIGLGRIGSAVARLATAFGMDVAYYDLQEKGGEIPYCPLNHLLAQSDVIVLAASRRLGELPLLGKREFQLMKRGSYLINPARRELVETAAVVSALSEGKLAGYAVDDLLPDLPATLELEPGRLLQSCHTAWYSTEAIARGTDGWVKNIIALGEGCPQHLVEEVRHG